MAKDVVAGAARQRRRRTRQGEVLSHELIVRTALRMLAEHGAQGLTARRLGLALGADPSALYRYFAGMDALVLAIADELTGRALAGWTSTGDWRQDLRTLGLRIHRAYLSHPQAAVLTASRVSGGPHVLTVDETVLSILHRAGFRDRDLARHYHVFIDSCLAFAALDAASLALPPAALAADERMWRTTYAALPSDTHPRIAETAPLLAARMTDSAYPDVLDTLIDRAAAELAAPATVPTGAGPVPMEKAPAGRRTRRGGLRPEPPGGPAHPEGGSA
ncbi:transcriptional regulator, TetR family [Actinacidiphila alni]|uniref:Transcriptional regulator, TetR family n=1 Tax=Actinacidiphila alni TaxID=380248 RepID=A0A1I2H3A0_9ACTN|nr:TetR/AcrR family transcriptional regulator [Actinacidiphila alni]SFF23873.1 transcriptional regulator, TetR family [Actinacidiphila alni]